MEWKVFQWFFKKEKEKEKYMKRLSFITQFNSRLSFYYRLSVVEKCLEKCLKSQGNIQEHDYSLE